MENPPFVAILALWQRECQGLFHSLFMGYWLRQVLLAQAPSVQWYALALSFLSLLLKMKILAISGSLRAASLNTALLRAMQAAAPAGVEVQLCSLHELPFFNEDLEAGGTWPSAVENLRQKVRAADALLVSTPEYNSGIPGVLKNAFDWLSRTNEHNPSVLMNKPMALVGATMGSFGTAIAQASALPMIRALGLQLWAGQRLALPQAHLLFNAQGELIDEATRTMLQLYMAGWVDSIAKRV